MLIFNMLSIHPLEFEFVRRHSLILLNMVNFPIIFALVCLILTTTTFGRIAKGSLISETIFNLVSSAEKMRKIVIVKCSA